MDISRSVGRAIRSKVNLPPDLMGSIGHQAVNRAMLGGGIAGLGAQGINMVTGNPDGSDDINVLAAVAAGAGMGAASSKLGEMNRARMAREQLAQAGYMDAQFGMNQVMANDSPFGVPGMAATGPKSSPFRQGAGPLVGMPRPDYPSMAPGGMTPGRGPTTGYVPEAAADPRIQSMFTPMSAGAVGEGFAPTMSANRPGLMASSEGFAPTMSAASNLPPLLKQALTPTANHGVPDAAPLGAAAISDLGVGTSNVAKTQVPTEIPGGTEVFAAPAPGMGPKKAYSTMEEALLAKANQEAMEGGKKLSQGTQLKSAEKRRNRKSDKEMEGLMP